MTIYSEMTPYYHEIFPLNWAFLDLVAHYVAAPGRALDVGCGTGHYPAQLSAGGYAVTAIDPNAAMIAWARKHDPATDYRVLSMLDVATLDPGFGLLYCIGNVLAYLPPARRGDFLASARQIAAPGAIWITQTVNWDALLGRETYDFPEIALPDRDVIFTRRYVRMREDSVSFQTALYVAGECRARDTHTLYPLLSEDALALHRAHGFELLGHFSNFEREPYQREALGGNVMVFRTRATFQIIGETTKGVDSKCQN